MFTDSMDMKAIAGRWGRGPAAVRALAAGGDVVMACGHAEAQWQSIAAVQAAAADGTLDQASLRRSAARIADAKTRYAGARTATADPAEGHNAEILHARATVPTPAFDKAAHEQAAQDIADRAVTLVRDEAHRVPLRAGRTAVLHVGTDAWVTSAPRLGEELRALLPDVTVAASAGDVTGRTWDAVVVVSLSWRSYEGTATIAALHREFGEKLVVVGAGNPYELARFPAVPAYLAAYGPDPPSMRAAAKVLAGRLEPRGRLPVAIPPLYPRGHSA